MEWLSLWLKNIILLVLLAAFLDLILPNTQLQKYVKVVMGLMILLTILTPVFSLFQFSPEELADRLERYQEQWAAPSRSQEDWRQLNDRLMEGANRQVTRYVEQQMTGRIREQVAAAYGKEVVSVDVGWRRGEGEHPEIASIDILLGGEPEDGGETRSIKPIEPVRVEIGGAEDPSDGVAVPAMRPVEDPVHRQIAEAVAEAWDLEPDQVRVAAEETRDDR